VIIEVLGVPAPKGSGRAMLIGGRARFIASGSSVNARRIKSWATCVRESALAVIGNVEAPPFVGVPLRVTIVFRVARPAGHWGKGKNAGKLTPSAPIYPTTKPDVDKLARSTFDALTAIVWDDDSRIVAARVGKAYAAPGREGATITIEAM